MGKPPRSWVIGVVLFGLALAACGGTSVEVFCESVVEAEASISNGPRRRRAAWAGQITEALTELEELAPDEVAPAVGTMTGILLPAIESGNEEARLAGLESTEFRAASEVVDGYMTDECDWQVADVTAVDYEYEADLAGVEAGYNGFAFENADTEQRLGNRTPCSSISSPVAMRSPVSSRWVATPDNMEALESGELRGPPHFSQGMLEEFTVEVTHSPAAAMASPLVAALRGPGDRHGH